MTMLQIKGKAQQAEKTCTTALQAAKVLATIKKIFKAMHLCENSGNNIIPTQPHIPSLHLGEVLVSPTVSLE